RTQGRRTEDLRQGVRQGTPERVRLARRVEHRVAGAEARGMTNLRERGWLGPTESTVIRLTLRLLVFIPGCALMAGMGSVHTGSNLAIQMIIGGIIGLFFGLVYGGAEGKWLDCIYPPTRDDDDIPRVYK